MNPTTPPTSPSSPPPTRRGVVLAVAGGPPLLAPPDDWVRALGLDPADHPAPPADPDELVLWFSDGPLALGFCRDGTRRAHRLDFDRDAPTDRASTALLCRAVGLGRGVRTVIDATAGFGRDSLALAAAGAEVTMIERHPVLAAMLRDALARAPDARGLRLIVADARDHLESLRRDASASPDAIYLDPMYPDRGKTALPRSAAQILRALHDHEETHEPLIADVELLRAARAIARRRVVVKRPPRAPALADGQTIAVMHGSRARYDIYAPSPRNTASAP
ncbi:MAG: class I SAM-dependent methyltransferase [Planctomycetota bacterium]